MAIFLEWIKIDLQNKYSTFSKIEKQNVIGPDKFNLIYLS